MIRNFTFGITPQLSFGSGKLFLLPSAVKSFGSRVLIVTGTRSFLSSAYGQTLLEQLDREGLAAEVCKVDREPTPPMIDVAVKKFSQFSPHCVLAIGGGSAIDAGKAISAMLPLKESVKDYIEGVGTKSSHPGVKVPFIAVPTTAGTGSEATKNAVISESGVNGYKRSLRHNNFVPDMAVVDPLLTVSCPPDTTASSGMDAFTQLLESYLSTAANPLTDALAYEGLLHVSGSLKQAYEHPADVNARAAMALGAYLSGVTLANAGLGLVHGFASAIGGYFEIPHGVICSLLMAPANKVTVRKLRLKNNFPGALRKYASVGKMFSATAGKSDEYYTDMLLGVIETLTNEMRIPKLSFFGVRNEDLEKIAEATGNKNNPINLERAEMREVLEMAL